MSMTISQLAAELSVSREAVRLQVHKLPASYVEKGKNRTTIINDIGVSIIREWFKADTANNNQDATTLQDDNDDDINLNKNDGCKTCAILQQHITTLERQLERQNEELEAKNKQISDLLQALQAEQIIHGKMLQLQEPKKPKWMFWKKDRETQ